MNKTIKDPFFIMGAIFTLIGFSSLFSFSSPPSNQNLKSSSTQNQSTLPVPQPASLPSAKRTLASTPTKSISEDSPLSQTVWILDEKGASGSDGKKLEDIISKLKENDEIKFRPGQYILSFQPKFSLTFKSETQKPEDVELIQQDERPLMEWDSFRITFENVTLKSTFSKKSLLKSPLLMTSNNAELSLKNVLLFINEKTSPHFINSKVMIERSLVHCLNGISEIYFEDSKLVSQFSFYEKTDFSFSFKSTATFQSDLFKSLQKISIFENSNVRFFKTKLSEDYDDLIGSKFSLDQNSTLLWEGKKISDLNNYRANLSFGKKPE